METISFSQTVIMAFLTTGFVYGIFNHLVEFEEVEYEEDEYEEEEKREVVIVKRRGEWVEEEK